MATGQIGGLIRDVPSCLDLVERIMAEARERLALLTDTPAAVSAC